MHTHKYCHCEALTEAIQKEDNQYSFLRLPRRTFGTPRNDVKKDKFHSVSRGFTLAEVLITLGIIGLVAEMTIPTIVSQYEDQAAAVALKKEVSVIQQAITMAELEEGFINDWYSGTDMNAATDAANSILSKHLKVINNCGRNVNSGCIPSYKYLSPKYSSNPPDYDADDKYSKMQLADGAIVFFNGSSNNLTFYPYIDHLMFYIDINGMRGPNKWGYDLFVFFVKSYKYKTPEKQEVMMPSGDINVNLHSLVNVCNVQSTSAVGSGRSCAAWVYYIGNRDYLHCQGLGPTKKTCN